MTRGPKGKKQKEVMAVDAETEQKTNVENDRREMEEVPDSVLLEAEEEPLRVSPTYPVFPEVQDKCLLKQKDPEVEKKILKS